MFSYVAAGFQVYRYLTITEKLDELTENEDMYPEFGRLANWQRLVSTRESFRLFFIDINYSVQLSRRFYCVLCVVETVQVHFI